MNITTLGIAVQLALKLLNTDNIPKVSDGVSIDEVNREIEQQDISLLLAQQQARVAQELAISIRIETAEEVEIEEFYDNSGKGNVGLKATDKALSLGIDGSGRKVTRRIYKFKGHNANMQEIYEQKLSEGFGAKIPEGLDQIKV